MKVAAPRLPALYPRQHAAICDPARTVIIEASTKSGKTSGCLLWLFAQAWNGGAGSYWWIAPTYSVAEQVAYLRMESMLKQGDPRGLCWKSDRQALIISLANGARMFFKTAERPDNLFGDDVRAAVIDEATRCSEESWNAVRSTLTATKGPVRIIGNVKGRKNWVYRLARMAEGGSPNMAFHKLTAFDAVAGGILDRDEIEDAKRVLPEAVFRELYLAEASEDGTNPFGADAIRDCIGPVSSARPVAIGVDLAKSSDWTVVCGLDADGCVCLLERWQGDWRATRERVARLVGNTRALIDSTGVGDPITEDLVTVCRAAEGFKFTSASKQQLMEGLAAAIQTRAIRYPDGWLRAELDSFGFRYTQGRVVYEASTGHDDGVCALALAVSARPKHRPLFFRAIP